MPTCKSHTICNWKRKGLICDDYNALYETYIKTTECQHCKTEFTEKNKRCLDHDHATGLFRKIVCHRCNAMDSYINYPNGFTEQDRKERDKEYRQKNKDKIKEQQQANKEKKIEYDQEYRRANKQKKSEQRSQKIECECGTVVSRSYIARHNRTKKHSDYKLNNLV